MVLRQCDNGILHVRHSPIRKLKFRPMALPYKVATLLYCFNERDEVLLLERAREPNRGFWSPCGGKLKMDIGESPYACACREAGEELGIEIQRAGFASDRSRQRTWLSRPDTLVDVFI